MSHTFPCNTTAFHQALFDSVHEAAEEARTKSCQFCGCTLHYANYPRTGFGVSHIEHAHFYQVRFSFCCAKCRRRTAPSSVRFLARDALLPVFLC